VTNIYPAEMDTDPSKARLAAMKERFGREIHVFETSTLAASSNAASSTAASSNEEETEDLNEFTAEDYYRIITATKKKDNILKTRKMREAEAEAEEASRRSKMAKVVVRVRFPDNRRLEATFHSSESVQALFDLLVKVIAQPEQPFHIYTIPPKKLITNTSQDFFTAGFCPGVNVYFSYDVPKGDSSVVDLNGPYLREEIFTLNCLDAADDQDQQSELVESAPEPVEATKPPPPVEERKPAAKKLPKWFKM